MSKNLVSYILFILATTYLGFLLLTKNVNAQIPQPYVGCGDSRTTEFHSLRPYQASPCNQQGEDLSMLCGNDMYLTDNMITYPYGPGTKSCNETTDTLTCYYEWKRGFSVTVDPSQSTLPIAGNTELVPNSQPASGTEELNSAGRVNEYLSWYLNGVVFRAEEAPLSPSNFEGVKKITDFSGPIRKLLPLRIQNEARETQITNKSNVPGIEYTPRHDQNVACVLRVTVQVPILRQIGSIISIFTSRPNTIGVLNLGGFPIQCSSSLLGNLVNSISPPLKLHDWFTNNKLPPKEENFDNFTDYFQAYRKWRGDRCVAVTLPESIPLVGGFDFLLCFDDPTNPNFFADLFPYIPFTSTEDRIGVLKVRKPQQTGGNVIVDKPIFKNKKQQEVVWNKTRLYVPHMEENDQLSSLLQTSYLPKEIGTNQTIGESQPVEKSSECKILDVRTNEGDKLFGEPSLGYFEYTAKFTCVYKIEWVQEDPTCQPSKKVTCAMRKVYKPPDCPRVAKFNSKIEVGTPLAGEIWKKLVTGNAAVVKRLFPELKSSGLGYFFDIPAVTPVFFSSGTNPNVSDSQPATVEPANPEIYFPHLGGIQEYFLKGIQTLLRPKGYGEAIRFAQSLSKSSNSAISREGLYEEMDKLIENDSDFGSSDNCPTTCSNLDAKDVDMTGVKANYQRVLDMWFCKEGETCFKGNPRTDKYNMVIEKSLAAGVNPIITLSIWLHESAGSNYTGICQNLGGGQADAGYCNRIQDFGINLPEVETVIDNNGNVLVDNFEKQLDWFLRLPDNYIGGYTSGAAKCPWEAFSSMFGTGTTSGHGGYTNEVHTVFKFLTYDQTTNSSDTFPCYPTKVNFK